MQFLLLCCLFGLSVEAFVYDSMHVLVARGGEKAPRRSPRTGSSSSPQTPQPPETPRRSPRGPAESPRAPLPSPRYQHSAWRREWAETSDSSGGSGLGVSRGSETITEVYTKGKTEITHKRYGQEPERKVSGKKPRFFPFHGSGKSRTKVKPLEPSASVEMRIHGGATKMKVDQRNSRQDGTLGVMIDGNKHEATIYSGEKDKIPHDATAPNSFIIGSSKGGGTLRGEVAPSKKSYKESEAE